MPYMDGIEVSQLIKEDKTTKDTPIIFLTALHDKKSEDKEHRVGDNIIFAKPFDTKELLETIKKLIR